ncbi:MAG: hypothetical protein EU536_00045 [Promethearchaeota archaeon]|nr:MAG: hypothetical protein EU536_00045 [Candidatus Lokiarchaeota archaeon]
MVSDSIKSVPKWQIRFKHGEEISNILMDLQYSDIFQNKYPVFKMQLAHELMNSRANQFFHIKRADQPIEFRDPTGKEVPIDSCIFIYGVSSELGIIKLVLIPQTEKRLVLAALDEVWIKVLENIDPSQRMTVITNVVASFITKPATWNQVYLIY